MDRIHHPVGPVVAFLQERLSAGLTPAMLKVHVAAIAAGHANRWHVIRESLPNLLLFMWRVPSWDLSDGPRRVIIRSISTLGVSV